MSPERKWWIAVTVMVASASVVCGGDGTAQAVRGTVTSEVTESPLEGVEIALLTATGDAVARVLSDSTGRYSLPIPETGNYRILADQIGYRRLESPLASLSIERVMEVDFKLPPDPVELDGLRVEVERRAELRARATQYGVRPATLGMRFIPQTEIDRRVDGRDFSRVLQWQSIPGMTILRGEDVGAPTPYVCVRITRGRNRCALTVLDGHVVPSEVAGAFPNEGLAGIIVLTPMEATLSFGTDGGGGAILLFSKNALTQR